MRNVNNREEILKALKYSEGHYISGARLAQELGVSRTAVWKQIKGLLKEGYKIESVQKLGYRLRHIPDFLLPSEIKDGLATRDFGQKIHFYHQLDSTQAVAKDLGAKGAPHGTVVVAEYQEVGRGRRERTWFCPSGEGVMFSVLLRPPLPPQKASIITLLAGVGTARGIKNACPLDCRLKWPNDIMAGDKKLGGILTEMASEIDKIHYLVLGIGVNVNVEEKSFPSELRERATSIVRELGLKVDRVQLLRRILEALEAEYLLLLSQGPGAVLNHWRELSATLGKEVEVQTGQTSFKGRALDIDEEGALILEQAGGQRLRVTSGDVVHLR